jgi:hypothetical protein
MGCSLCCAGMFCALAVRPHTFIATLQRVGLDATKLPSAQHTADRGAYAHRLPQLEPSWQADSIC